MIIDVKTCARCNEDHPELEFTPLTHSQNDWTHWAACPANGEPIMLSQQTEWESFCDELLVLLVAHHHLMENMIEGLDIGRSTISRWARRTSYPVDSIKRVVIRKFPAILEKAKEEEAKSNWPSWSTK